MATADEVSAVTQRFTDFNWSLLWSRQNDSDYSLLQFVVVVCSLTMNSLSTPLHLRKLYLHLIVITAVQYICVHGPLE
jgi:hypothetical protein